MGGIVLCPSHTVFLFSFMSTFFLGKDSVLLKVFDPRQLENMWLVSPLHNHAHLT